MLIKILTERMEQEVGAGLLRGIRHVRVATPDGTIHEIIGVEKTLGGDLVLVVEPQDER
jgi:hypothetical protein